VPVHAALPRGEEPVGARAEVHGAHVLVPEVGGCSYSVDYSYSNAAETLSLKRRLVTNLEAIKW
jgi:hypothetical protein